MNQAEIESTLKLVFVAIWFATPAFLVARLHRFRIASSAIVFWALGTFYFGVISPPRTSLDFGHDWPFIGWLPGLLYAAMLARVHTKRHHAQTASAFLPTTSPNENGRNG